MARGPNANEPQTVAGSTTDAAPADFAALFKSSFRSLWLIAFGVVQDAALAEDVVQEAALIALSKFKEFRPGSNFSAWMAKIVQFVARNQARSRRRRRTVNLDAAAAAANPATEPGAAGRSPVAVAVAVGWLSADQQHFDDRVMAALRQVPDLPRACLLLRTLEGLEYSEIARVLRIPAGTAMSHVHRTRQFLREALADLGPLRASEGQAPT